MDRSLVATGRAESNEAPAWLAAGVPLTRR